MGWPKPATLNLFIAMPTQSSVKQSCVAARTKGGKNAWFATFALLGLASLVQIATGATVFVQPSSVGYSAASAINTPSALIGNVSSINDSHPNPTGGGGGTSWYATTWVGQYLSFDFSSPMPLLSFHLWDYYDHSAESYQLVLYDGAGGSGSTLYDNTFDISPNRGGSNFTVRWDHTFPSEVSGVLSGRLYLQGPENSPTYPNAGLAEIGFTAVPEPSRTMLLLVGASAFALRRRR